MLLMNGSLEDMMDTLMMMMMFLMADGTEKGLETDMENSLWILVEQRCERY